MARPRPACLCLTLLGLLSHVASGVPPAEVRPTPPNFLAAERGARHLQSEPTCFAGLQSVGEYLACLASVPIEPARRDCALDIIFGQLRSLYTYSGLVMDSLKTDAELAPGFDFKVHEVALGSYIDDIEHEMRRETSAGMLAMKLTAMFGKFQDAHTAIYVNPLLRTKFVPPFKIDVRLDEATGEMQLMVAESQSWTPAGLEGRVLTSINSAPPLDYFLEVTALSAKDKTPGTRLNRYLRSQYLRSVPPKDGGVFNATFDDGQSHEFAWQALVSEELCHMGDDYKLCSKEAQLDGSCTNATEVMKKCLTHSPTFDSMVELFHTLGREVRCTEGGTPAAKVVNASGGAARKAKSAPALPRPGALADPRPGETMEAPVLEESPLFALDAPIMFSDDALEADNTTETSDDDAENVTSNATAAQAFQLIEMLKVVENSCYVFRVDVGGGSFASVLKITRFGEFKDLLPCLEVAVDLAAEVSDGKLVIDVIGNGGGYVSSGYSLNSYLYSKMLGSTMARPHEACEWYDMPLNHELSWFVGLSEKGLPELPDVGVREFVASLAGRMDVGVEALGRDPEFFGRSRKAGLLNESASCLRTLLSRFAEPEVPERDTQAWTVFASLYGQCLGLSEPLGAKRGMEIMGYYPGNVYPLDISPPTWEHYLKPVTKVRGGKARQFSRFSFLGRACPGYAAAFPEHYGTTNLTDSDWARPQTKLKHIVYLSDGTCGSTCSVSSSSPFLDGMATFVTYGGVKGQPLDITSFNGGNVGTYQSESGSDLSKSALDSVVDASVFYPSSAPPNWPFLPVPLNVYKLRFAQRAEYPRALGPKALPREWYLIPASYHLDVWATHSFRKYETLEQPALDALHGLYVLTAAKAPKPLRRRGQA